MDSLDSLPRATLTKEQKQEKNIARYSRVLRSWVMHLLGS